MMLLSSAMNSKHVADMNHNPAELKEVHFRWSFCCFAQYPARSSQGTLLCFSGSSSDGSVT
jgi:hypothetical protein